MILMMPSERVVVMSFLAPRDPDRLERRHKDKASHGRSDRTGVRLTAEACLSAFDHEPMPHQQTRQTIHGDACSFQPVPFGIDDQPPGFAQIGAFKLRSIEDCFGEVRAVEYRRTQIRPAQVNADKSRVPEVGAFEVESAECGIVQLTALEGQRKKEAVARVEADTQQLAFLEVDRSERGAHDRRVAQVTSFERAIAESGF